MKPIARKYRFEEVPSEKERWQALPPGGALAGRGGDGLLLGPFAGPAEPRENPAGGPQKTPDRASA